ncbi:hypothetical protein ABZ470_10310 [Streptosporangium sp. NPDC020072]|uniref:hypothetical protein n=1 Tax=Streptosporangium sp. NPDC020072 TaxID=3154788 RepID=UPI003441A6F5
MTGELTALAAQVSPYVVAAVSAYGGAVLSRVQEGAADSTIEWGRRLIQRISGTRELGEAVPEAVQDLAVDPGNQDLQAVLRVRIAQALMADAILAEDIRRLLQQATTSGARVVAAGERSVGAHTISGIVVTGDKNNVYR